MNRFRNCFNCHSYAVLQTKMFHFFLINCISCTRPFPQMQTIHYMLFLSVLGHDKADQGSTVCTSCICSSKDSHTLCTTSYTESEKLERILKILASKFLGKLGDLPSSDIPHLFTQEIAKLSSLSYKVVHPKRKYLHF